MDWVRAAPLSLLALLALVLALAHPQSAVAQDCNPNVLAETLTGEEVAERLFANEKVLLDSVRIEGDIDLTGVDSVVGAFILTNSVVEGRLKSPFAIFHKTVDFTGSCFAVAADLRGSIFEGETGWSDTRFGVTTENSTDIRGALFRGTADMRGARFSGPAMFEHSTFEDRAFLSGAEFLQKVDFSSARFRGTADMRMARFGGPATFEDSTFEDKALLGQAEFFRDAEFTRASFGKRATFARAVFHGRASFDDASAVEDVDFSGVQFFRVAAFRRLSAPGLLNLRDAAFGGKVFLDDASVGALELGNDHFREGVELSMADIDAGSLAMDLKDVDRIDDDAEKREILESVERTARDKGKAEIANDASFRRQVLANKGRNRLWQVATFVFGQEMAGYLVRPVCPLRAMLILAFLAAIVRVTNEYRRSRQSTEYRRSRQATQYRRTRQATRGGRSIITPARCVSHSFVALGTSLSVAIVPKPPKISLKPEDRDSLRAVFAAGARWAEWVSQKTLNVILLIAVGNTAPAAKDIIDSILKL